MDYSRTQTKARMHSLLTKLLQKRGIQSPEELSPEEKKTFEEWKTILAKEELTLDDLKTFCQYQIDVIESKWNDLNIDAFKKGELIPYHTVYKNISLAITSPRSSRETLEKHLLELTK